LKGAKEKGTRVRGSISKGLHLREGKQKSFDRHSKIGARGEEKILKITGRVGRGFFVFGCQRRETG
jgi:hypothetical protein